MSKTINMRHHVCELLANTSFNLNDLGDLVEDLGDNFSAKSLYRLAEEVDDLIEMIRGFH